VYLIQSIVEGENIPSFPRVTLQGNLKELLITGSGIVPNGGDWDDGGGPGKGWRGNRVGEGEGLATVWEREWWPTEGGTGKVAPGGQGKGVGPPRGGGRG